MKSKKSLEESFKPTQNPRKVLLLSGPTASGKTHLSLDLAKQFGLEIINGDSIQMYQGFDIGSAKVSKSIREQIKHHLIDHIEDSRQYNAAEFRKDVSEILKDHFQKSRKPVIIVGGSGFYFNALTLGLFDLPQIPAAVKDKWKLKVTELGTTELHREIIRLDPAQASRIQPNDTYRITRFFEVLEVSGKTISALQKEFTPNPLPYQFLKVAMNVERKILLERIKQRTSEMIENGLLTETQSLLKAKDPLHPAFGAVGYRQVIDFFEGRIKTEKDLVEQIQISTNQLAKRQMTWLRKVDGLVWWDSRSLEPQELITHFLDAKSID
jgi:tRNA dimethylallyltransferase